MSVTEDLKTNKRGDVIVPPVHDTGKGAYRVLTMSTIDFTVMFAVWLMFGILGKPIQAEFGLTDVELSWISAVAAPSASAAPSQTHEKAGTASPATGISASDRPPATASCTTVKRRLSTAGA